MQRIERDWRGMDEGTGEGWRRRGDIRERKRGREKGSENEARRGRKKQEREKNRK